MSVTDEIKRKITENLAPAHFELVDESHKHEGHAGHNGQGESHFRLLIVSDSFKGQGRIERQQAVYRILQTELNGPIHALSLQTLTTSEYKTG